MPKPKPWKAAALEMRARLADHAAVVVFSTPDGLASQTHRLQLGLSQRITTPTVTFDGVTVRGATVDVTVLRVESRIPGPRTDESAGQVLARLGYDGAKWAAEMALHFPIDPAPGGHFHTWIANAIEAGVTEGERRERERRVSMVAPLDRALEDLAAEYGTLSVLRKAREKFPESWRAVKAVVAEPEYVPAPAITGMLGYVGVDGEAMVPSRPMSADVAERAEMTYGQRLAKAGTDPEHARAVVAAMPADEAQARHDGFTEAIRESEQRIAAAVAIELPGTSVPPHIVDPVAAGIIDTMAYTSRQQQAEINQLRRGQSLLRETATRIVTERDNARTQLAQLSDRHQAMAFELAEHRQKVLDVLKAYDDLQTTSGQYKAERDEARRERDSAQGNVTTLLDENAQLNVRIEQLTSEMVEERNNATAWRAYAERYQRQRDKALADLATALNTPADAPEEKPLRDRVQPS